MSGRRVIEVFTSAADAAARGAALFLNAARQALAARGHFTVALSGGTSPIPFFRSLACEAMHSGVDWAAVHVFWADERCVPPDHVESNFRLADDLFLSRLPVPGATVHRVPGELPPDEAARRYEEELARSFPFGDLPVFDLVLLGVGNDGHTASLFPGTALDGFPGRKAVAVYVEKLKSHRVTLTLPVINNARQVVFLVTGAGKARIVAEILEGADGAGYPAAQVVPRKGRLVWLLDGDAASKLENP